MKAASMTSNFLDSNNRSQTKIKFEKLSSPMNRLRRALVPIRSIASKVQSIYWFENGSLSWEMSGDFFFKKMTQYSFRKCSSASRPNRATPKSLRAKKFAGYTSSSSTQNIEKAVFQEAKQSRKAANALIPWQQPIRSNLAATAYSKLAMFTRTNSFAFEVSWTVKKNSRVEWSNTLKSVLPLRTSLSMRSISSSKLCWFLQNNLRKCSYSQSLRVLSHIKPYDAASQFMASFPS